MSTRLPASVLPLTAADRNPVDPARRTIDAATDAGPGEDGIHTMGAAIRTAPVSIAACDLLPPGFVPPAA